MEIPHNKRIYIDPLTDFGFKRIFGSAPDKALLISFLNEVFKGNKQIADLVFQQHEFQGETKEEGTVIFDLLCCTDNGEQILIEIQRTKQKNFFQRALFYGSRLISAQIPAGKRRNWGYRFSGVYVIAVLDGFALPYTPPDQYLHHFCLSDRYSGNFVYEDFGLLFIELLKFDKQEQELESDLDRWLYVLKHMSTLHKLPAVLNKPVFERLFDIAAYVNLSKNEKAMYDISLKRKWDEEGARMAIRFDLECERKEGLQQGIEKGIEIGIQEGLMKGQLTKAFKIASSLRKMGMSYTLICEATGLSEEEVSNL